MASVNSTLAQLRRQNGTAGSAARRVADLEARPVNSTAPSGRRPTARPARGPCSTYSRARDVGMPSRDGSSAGCARIAARPVRPTSSQLLRSRDRHRRPRSPRGTPRPRPTRARLSPRRSHRYRRPYPCLTPCRPLATRGGRRADLCRLRSVGAMAGRSMRGLRPCGGGTADASHPRRRAKASDAPGAAVRTARPRRPSPRTLRHAGQWWQRSPRRRSQRGGGSYVATDGLYRSCTGTGGQARPGMSFPVRTNETAATEEMMSLRTTVRYSVLNRHVISCTPVS